MASFGSYDKVVSQKVHCCSVCEQAEKEWCKRKVQKIGAASSIISLADDREAAASSNDESDVTSTWSHHRSEHTGIPAFISHDNLRHLKLVSLATRL